jgi:hypothetical protein
MKHEFFVVNDKTGNNTSIKQKTRNKQFVDRNLCILGCIFFNRTGKLVVCQICCISSVA